jgi:hypothetical protein
MNRFEGLFFLFKGMLFLDGHLTPGSFTREELGEGYGNKLASDRQFSDGFEPQYGRREAGVNAANQLPTGCV